MPQMNPMNWLILLLYFNLLFLVTMSKIHFSNLNMISPNEKKKAPKKTKLSICL